MFYCGFDPSFEAYLADAYQDPHPLPFSHVATVTTLVAVSIAGFLAAAVL